MAMNRPPPTYLPTKALFLNKKASYSKIVHAILLLIRYNYEETFAIGNSKLGPQTPDPFYYIVTIEFSLLPVLALFSRTIGMMVTATKPLKLEFVVLLEQRLLLLRMTSYQGD